MSTRAVAVEQEVSATPGTVPFTGATAGTWSAGPVVCTSYPRYKIGGTPVIYRAQCTFVFSGTSGSSAVTGTETVTLTASGSAVLRSAQAVLLDRDLAVGTFGNTLRVQARGRMGSI